MNFFLKQNGAPAIKYDDFIVSAILKGKIRPKGDAVRQAPPILPEMLLRVFAEITLNPWTYSMAGRHAVLLQGQT